MAKAGKIRVALFGGSGTMGFEAFKALWARRDEFDIVLLLRPSEKNRRLMAPFAREARLPALSGPGRADGEGLSIQWGDAGAFGDVKATIRGVDAVLDAMAFISPQADYHPEQARVVNTEGVRNIVRAIEEEPEGRERIRFAYTGTVAETGDRMPPIHWGRVGDPLKPSIYDFYAATKIAGERAVLESGIRHWVSLRMTYIMPVDYADYMSLMDPIMFHMPLASCMENVSSRDAGFGLVNCLDVPPESDFWRRAYNMGGGPGMRITAYDYQNKALACNGISGIKAVAERKWFALGNFHMQYFEDSPELERYLHFWRDDYDSWERALFKDTPLAMRAVAFLAKRLPGFRARVEAETRKRLGAMAERHKNGTAYWAAHGNEKRIEAFYGSRAAYDAIPGWDAPLPEMKSGDGPVEKRLSHGYDESKARLDISDLRGAAAFRGGSCLSGSWTGDLYEAVEWECAFGHRFSMKPYTALKAGHWCPECEGPPWRYHEIAARNPFFAQVWTPLHAATEDRVYEEADIADIAGAD
ncbi:MAG: NAD(P)-dependent oxidoreductase [Spirochaetes bacterium]|nr:NAD(P)-dependent oxidoreductase [Spirochaetota bacterium]MBU1079233.1 NAD(P)-dependent oxidoreductase [Spirochaetota bacterium]